GDLARRLGGSTRSVLNPEDASRTSRDLLDEFTRPALQDLRAEFLGIEVAAVYPDRLPSLAAGTQLVIVGRYDAFAKSTAGTLVVHGVMDGQARRYETQFVLPRSDEGNSFIPRLWARSHLDHLLRQGSGPEVREKIVALSEDFQIITPYTSFLVLESDADRERFKVEKRFKLREGEEFFAKGRQDANEDLARQHLLEARAWRLALRRTILDDFARRGADIWPTAGQDGSQIVTTSGLRGSRHAFFGRDVEMSDQQLQDASYVEDYDLESLDDGNQGFNGIPESEEAFELSFQDEMIEFESNSKKKDRDQGRPYDSLTNMSLFLPPASAGIVIRAAGGYSYLGQRSGDDQWPGQASWELSQAFPPLPQLPRRTTATKVIWDAEFLNSVQGFDRREALQRSGTSWSFKIESRQADGHRPDQFSSREMLIAPDRWLATNSETSQTHREWCNETQRGLLLDTWSLGRQRSMVSGDAADWPAPFEGWFQSLEAVVGNLRVVVVTSSERMWNIVLEDPDRTDDRGICRRCEGKEEAPHARQVLKYDPRRKVLYSHLWVDCDGSHRELRFEDIVEVGGIAWPTRLRWIDQEGRTTKESSIVVETLEPAPFEARFASGLAGLS
ncbi:MAG: hypothetical protein KDB18_13970, partial [Salinibacterium sp.]|nr:hypothetical protein [Salinibacterium sp.]